MVWITSRNIVTEEADDGDVGGDECMYELVLRMAVATERRTFLLLERAQALEHSTILMIQCREQMGKVGY